MAAFDYIIDQFISKGLSQNLTGNAIQKALQDAGLGVRRQDLQSRIRELQNVPQRASVLRFVPNSKMPSAAQFTEGGNYMKNNYLYHVRIDAVDNNTGENLTWYQMISSNSLITPGEAKSTAIERLPFENPKYDFRVTGSALERIDQAPTDLP